MKTTSHTYSHKDTNLFLDNPLKEYILKIRDVPMDERPRQKLLHHGVAILSLAELLAVVFNVGSRSEDVLEMTNRLVREYGEKSIFAEVNATKMAKDFDVPIVKACQIVACGELGRRLYERNSLGFTIIRNAKDAYEHLREMKTLPKEHLRGLYLNSHNRVIHDEVISIGTINTNIVHPREVFRPAIEYSAVAVILAHNHPSGNLVPSDADVEVTEQLVEAGKMVGIHLLDHIIITDEGYVSIKVSY